MITAQAVKQLRDMTGAGMMDCKKALVETNGDMDEAVKWLREKGIMKAQKKESRIAAEGVCTYAIDGNKAVVYEVNSETDFAAKGEKFLALVDKIGKALLASNAKNDEEALASPTEDGTVKDSLVNATAIISEKISLRRVNFFEKKDDEVFGKYIHMGGRIASLCIVKGANEEVAKDVAMHIAAMNPKYLDESKVDSSFLQSETEIAKQETLNDPKNASKPEMIIDKIVQGKVAKILKEVCLVDQLFVKNPDFTVGQYVANAKGEIESYIRLEVGEGIEKRNDDFAAEVAAAAAAAQQK